MDYVKINCNIFNLEYNKLQDFVKYAIQKLLETESLSEEEIENLENKEYCKEIFNLDYPLLSKEETAYAKDTKHHRYYAKSGFYVKGYYLCNHWFKRNEDKFTEWLKNLSD